MAEKRNVHVKVTSNVNSVLNKMGDTAGKQGKKTSGALGKIKGLFSGIASSAGAATGGIRAMTTALISSGVGAIVVALGSMVALFKRALTESMEFSKSLSTLKAISGASAEEMNALSNNAKELGSSTKFTASQVVELQTEFAKLGFSTGAILDVTKATLDLAAATGTDLANAAMVAGNTLNGFGLDTAETGRVADVMAKAFSSSALDIEKFQESMKLVAPIAKVTKVSIEESSAALSILADRGVAGSLAGTQLRKIMADLASKTGKNFQDSLEITASRLDAATTTADKLAIAKELVGDRAKGSLIALAENRLELDKLTTAYENAAGAAEDTATIMQDNLTGDIVKLSSAWSGFLLGLEDGTGILNELSRGAIQFFTGALSGLSHAGDVLSFTFTDMWRDIKGRTKNGVEFASVYFGILGENIQIFANKSMLLFSKIPILGSGIDKAKAEANIKDAEDTLVELNTRLGAAQDVANNLNLMRANRQGRFLQQMADRDAANKLRKEKEAAKNKVEEFVEGTGGIEEDPEVKRLQAIEDFKNKLKKKSDDFDAKTKQEKNQLARERHLAELEELELNEIEKRELIESVNRFYDDKANTIKAEEKILEDEAKVLAAGQLEIDTAAEAQRVIDEENFKKDSINRLLDASIGAAGQESKVAKALYVVKQILALKELVAQAKTSMAKAKMKASESMVDVAGGFGKAAATLQPWVIAGYAASAIGIVASITSALGNVQKATGGGGGVSMPSIKAPSSAPNKRPDLNVIGSGNATKDTMAKVTSSIERNQDRPLKAYVVESEVTSTQSLASKTRDSASF
jgi:hypothetical protein